MTRRVKNACLVCGKPCQPFERNTDGTYAHDHCLATNLTHAREKS